MSSERTSPPTWAGPFTLPDCPACDHQMHPAGDMEGGPWWWACPDASCAVALLPAAWDELRSRVYQS